MTAPLSHLNKVGEPCVHCGELCATEIVVASELAFCCVGCQVVYELFQENGLEHYYSEGKKPGLSKARAIENDYSFLDQVQVQEKLLLYRDGELAKVRFFLPQIYCTSCIWLLEHLYKLDKGIDHSNVNFIKKEVFITYQESETSLEKIAQLLAHIGFPPQINLVDLEDTPLIQNSKTLYYKIGLTGFLFGNIMLFSFPEYLGLKPDNLDNFSKLFSYLNLALSIPLITYSAKDYLKSAIHGIKQKHLSIDVPIALGIITLFGRSVFEILTHTGPGFLDSLAGLLFFLLLGKWFQQVTYTSISFERDYKSYFPISANRIEDNKVKSVSLNELAVGDVLIVKNEELIPADSVLLSESAKIDYSFVTGESKLKSIEKGAKIFAGGRHNGAAIKLKLQKKVVHSYLVELWNEHVFIDSKIEKHSLPTVDKIGKYFTIGILIIAFGTLFFWYPKNPILALNAFTAVLIIACPCAIALTIPFTYGNVLRILSRNNFFLKNIETIKKFNKVTSVVFDKTGTLTTRKEELEFSGYLTDYQRSIVFSLVSQSNHPRSQQIAFSLSAHENNKVVSSFKSIPGTGIHGEIEGHFVEVRKAQGMISGTEILIDKISQGVFKHLPQLRRNLNSLFDFLKPRNALFLLSGDSEGQAEFFKDFFEEKGALNFNQSPKDKLEFIKKLQQEGQNVMMIGDGLNDAGALYQSEIGLVVTENNNNFSPACDGIISADSFSDLPAYLNFISASRNVVFACYVFAIMYNVFGLSFAVQGLLSPVIAAILMPLSAITIILIGTVSTTVLSKMLITFKKDN